MKTLADEVDPREAIDETGETNDPRAVWGHYGFLPWEFIHFNLPYRAPKTDRWVRENGLYRLNVTAGEVTQPDGSYLTMVPHGKYARAGLLWMCTEAKLTKKPTIELGHSYRQFMTNLGVAYGTRQSALALRQIRALFAATFQITTKQTDDDRRVRVRDDRYLFAKHSDLWFGSKDSEDMDTLMPSTVTISDELFGSILERGTPVDMNAWRWLQENSISPMVLDIYTWLSSRLPSVQRPVRLNWVQLHDQFGSASDLPQFKRNFRRALATVKDVYPGANVTEVGEGERTRTGFKGLVLNPSMAAVSR